MKGRILVIGGGIAGASAAYALAPHCDVILLERESTLAYHTTGRSAAQYIENYGVPSVRSLTRASHPFLSNPPNGLADHALLSPCAVMMIARPDQTHLLAAMAAEPGGAEMLRLDPTEAIALCPILRPEYVAGALLEADAADIDVAALHQAFVRGIRMHGGVIRTNAGVTALEATTNGWKATCSDDVMEADLVINAAGAWGDQIAALAGIPPVGLVPKRRTAFMVTAPVGMEGIPMVVDIEEQFYCKPDGPQMLCSPAEEEPSEPCDARPHEIDIAIAIERINQATTLAIRSVKSSWTGLRTFVHDNAPVVGEDPDHPGFVWLVGQGGTGIQTAASLGGVVASIVAGVPLPDGVGPEVLEGISPRRLRDSES